MPSSTDRADEPAPTAPRRVPGAAPIALAVLSAVAVGLWWLLVPQVLSALTLGLAARHRPAQEDPRRRRGWGAAVGVAAAVLVLSLANDLATTSGRAFLPRWE